MNNFLQRARSKLHEPARPHPFYPSIVYNKGILIKKT